MFFTSTSAVRSDVRPHGNRTRSADSGRPGGSAPESRCWSCWAGRRDCCGSVAVLAVWLPWLIYAAIRTDFSITMPAFTSEDRRNQFMSVIALTIVYRAKPKASTGIFIPTITSGIALVAKTCSTLMSSCMRRSSSERPSKCQSDLATRSFAVAAVCVMFLPPVLETPSRLFGIAMIPTGSRGPLIALIVVALLYLSMNYFRRETPPDHRGRGLVAVVGGLLWAAFRFVAGYFSVTHRRTGG